MKIHIIGGPGSGYQKTNLVEIRRLLDEYPDKVVRSEA